MFYDNSGAQLEISSKKMSRYTPNAWKFMKKLLNNHRSKIKSEYNFKC